MTFLNQEISFDIGHFILLFALVILIFIVSKKCVMRQENLSDITGGVNVPQVSWTDCRCPNCVAACTDKANNGYLYGCNPNDPLVPFSGDQCISSYRKCALHGCGVA